MSVERVPSSISTMSIRRRTKNDQSAPSVVQQKATLMPKLEKDFKRESKLEK